MKTSSLIKKSFILPAVLIIFLLSSCSLFTGQEEITKKTSEETVAATESATKVSENPSATESETTIDEAVTIIDETTTDGETTDKDETSISEETTISDETSISGETTISEEASTSDETTHSEKTTKESASGAEKETEKPKDTYRGLAGKTASEYIYLVNPMSEKALKKIDKIIEKIITDEMSTIEKIRAVHDWMIINVDYDEKFDCQTIDTALFKGLTVCNGYADLFNVFMSEIGIESNSALGHSREVYHMWNCVKLDDDLWYFIDVTWDDPSSLMTGMDGTVIEYNYFLLPRKNIEADHEFEKDWAGTNGKSLKWHKSVCEGCPMDTVKKDDTNAETMIDETKTDDTKNDETKNDDTKNDDTKNDETKNDDSKKV